mgnify:CR=1 FL=1
MCIRDSDKNDQIWTNYEIYNDKDWFQENLKNNKFEISKVNKSNVTIHKNSFSSLFKKEFVDEKISVYPIDYYYSNVIARSSKTMMECRNLRKRVNKTGTEG